VRRVGKREKREEGRVWERGREMERGEEGGKRVYER
jgi:hypothetical protein